MNDYMQDHQTTTTVTNAHLTVTIRSPTTRLVSVQEKTNVAIICSTIIVLTFVHSATHFLTKIILPVYVQTFGQEMIARLVLSLVSTGEL